MRLTAKNQYAVQSFYHSHYPFELIRNSKINCMAIATNDLAKFEAAKQLISNDITKHYSIHELAARVKLNEFKYLKNYFRIHNPQQE
jgi:hypothetical protein